VCTTFQAVQLLDGLLRPVLRRQKLSEKVLAHPTFPALEGRQLLKLLGRLSEPIQSEQWMKGPHAGAHLLEDLT